MKYLKPLFIAVLLTFVFQQPVFAATKPAPLYSVVKVVDGDTIDIKIGTKVERIRMIGMDTPETVDPRKPVQCFGKEASARAKQLLLGKQVQLVADPTQGERDKYGRLLRYVIADGLNFNKRLIAEGYAHEYTYNIPYKYQAYFKQTQKEAQKAQKGLWSPTTCAGGKTTTAGKTSPTPTPKPTASQSTATQSTATPAVKKSVTGLCHEKGSMYYDQTKTFTAYSTIAACLASGGKMPQ